MLDWLWTLASYGFGLAAFSYVVMVVHNRMGRKPMSYRGKHVIVTGASEGLGLAVAQAVSERGGKVSLVARRPEKLSEAAASLSHAFTASADVADPHALAAALAQCEAHFGPCDILIPCAGFAAPGFIEDTTVETYRRSMEVNYLGTVHAVKAVLPGMQARRSGHIVIVTSALALTTLPGYTQYCPTKYALRAFADCLRMENLRHNIQTSIYFPSNIDTPGYEAENRSKPALTKKLEDAGQLYSAKQAAEALLAGLDLGHYRITPDFMTLLLGPLNGIAPHTHFLTEALLAALLPWVAGPLRLYYDSLCRKA